MESHLAPAQRLAAGLHALPKVTQAFAGTQAAWRFYHNPRVSPAQLGEPLREVARRALAAEPPGGEADDQTGYALVVHDWSNLHYKTHPSKPDRTTLSQSKDLGYELQTALLISARDGQPIAPVAQTLQSADGVRSSFGEELHEELQPAPSVLDGLAPLMQSAEELVADAAASVATAETARPVVHIVDAEADSVAHYRQWHAAGRLFLVRADASGRVEHEGQSRRLDEVAALLAERGEFQAAREVEYEGRRAWQQIAQTEVILVRAARPQRPKSEPGPRKSIPGPPLPLRLVVSRVFDAQGALLAQWLLLTNLPGGVLAGTVALWYYWRWRIESYFKLLKTAGHCLEQWQQETAEAVFRRLLIAGMACVVVWQLAHAEGPAADEVRRVLVRLSGRQMKHKVPFTQPALLLGLWTLLRTLAIVEQYDLETLRQLAESIRPTLHPSSKDDV